MPGSRVRSMPWRSWRQAARMQTGRPLPGSTVRRDDRELLLGHSVDDPPARRRDGLSHLVRQRRGAGGVQRESTAHGNAPRAELRTRVGPRLGRGHQRGPTCSVSSPTDVGNTLAAESCGRGSVPRPAAGPPRGEGRPAPVSSPTGVGNTLAAQSCGRTSVPAQEETVVGEGRPEVSSTTSVRNTLGAGLRTRVGPRPRGSRGGRPRSLTPSR